MYDELVKRLRNCATQAAPCLACDMTDDGSCIETLMKQAADVIEATNRRETPMKITEIHVDEYYCPACGAENNCDQGYVQDAYCPVCGQRLLQEE